MKTADGTKKISFHITAADIRRGRRKDPERCAAALALKRQLHADKVEVHISRTYVEVGGRRQRFGTPQALKEEIIAIDRGGAFEPGSYALKPIPKSQTTSALADRARERKKLKRPAGRKRRLTPNVRRRGPK
jgi:hypothetical protein